MQFDKQGWQRGENIREICVYAATLLHPREGESKRGCWAKTASKVAEEKEKKCACSHIHLISLVRAAVYFPTQFPLLCRFSLLWFYVTRQKITFCQTTFQAPHLTQFTPACCAVSFTICTVGIAISFFIHPSKSAFHHPPPSISINQSIVLLISNLF